MTELTIRNQDILDQLEYVRSIVMNANVEQYANDAMFRPENARTEGESYLTKQWLDNHMADPEHQFESAIKLLPVILLAFSL